MTILFSHSFLQFPSAVPTLVVLLNLPSIISKNNEFWATIASARWTVHLLPTSPVLHVTSHTRMQYLCRHIRGNTQFAPACGSVVRVFINGWCELLVLQQNGTKLCSFWLPQLQRNQDCHSIDFPQILKDALKRADSTDTQKDWRPAVNNRIRNEQFVGGKPAITYVCSLLMWCRVAETGSPADGWFLCLRRG